MAREYGVSLNTVQRWLGRADGQRLDRVDWDDRSSRPSRVSILGEHGAKAIGRALEELADAGVLGEPLPTVRTIGRILSRRGVLDARRRTRRPAPPAGWYLADVAARRVELDSFDVIDGLKTRRGPAIDVLTGISLHGGCPPPGRAMA